LFYYITIYYDKLFTKSELRIYTKIKIELNFRSIMDVTCQKKLLYDLYKAEYRPPLVTNNFVSDKTSKSNNKKYKTYS